MRATVALGLVRTAAIDERQRHRARHMASEWTKIIAAQRRSKLTIVEYCRRRDIALATFGYWRRRLAQPVAIAQPAQRFLAVPLVAPAAAPIAVDIGTLRVRLEGAAAARVIDAIVARIGGEATR
jgi:hypothetical protein